MDKNREIARACYAERGLHTKLIPARQDDALQKTLRLASPTPRTDYWKNRHSIRSSRRMPLFSNCRRSQPLAFQTRQRHYVTLQFSSARREPFKLQLFLDLQQSGRLLLRGQLSRHTRRQRDKRFFFWTQKDRDLAHV